MLKYVGTAVLVLAFIFDIRQNNTMSAELSTEPATRAGRKTSHFIVGVFTLAAALIGIASITIASFQRAVTTEQIRLDADMRATQGLEALLAAEQAYNSLQDAERSQRGYVITENPIFLEPYNDAIAAEPALTDALERLVGDDNKDQTNRLNLLRKLTALKLEEMANSVELVRAGQMTAARNDVSSGYGRRLMEQIRSVMDDLIAEQRRLLKVRREAVIESDAAGAQSIYRLAALGIALLVSAMVSMAALAYMVYRTKLAVERELAGEEQRGILEAAVAERTLELTKANEHLRSEIESREAVEDRLRQGQRLEAVGQLTGGIAHDFNNMLAVVISSLDLLRRRVKSDDPKINRLIDNAREGADRAATLTARLLAFSRQQSLNPETVDVNALVDSVVNLLGRTLGERIQIEKRQADNIPPIFIDSAELENALINLAANARDAMPDGGTLVIETARRSVDKNTAESRTGHAARTYAVISIIDTGEGIPADVVERVFEPFFTTKPVGKGTGLGLSQVHGFLHQSGGFIEIDSTPGEGTRVDLLLPEQMSAKTPSFKTSEALQPLATGTADESILVVEDEAQLRTLTVEHLRELGYTVRHAGNGEEALKILDEHPGIGLLFTDVVMPGLTGDALARAALEESPEIKVLYTSGYAKTGGEGDDALDPPADLLRKPFTIQALAAKIRETFDRETESNP